MTIHTILFNLFASLAIATGIGVIISKNPIHSVIFLILVFCNATGLLLLFKIELLAMMFIIIYVGAIAVLFLFVVMMLNIKMNEPNIESKENTYDSDLKIKIFKTPLVVGTILIIIGGLIMTWIWDNNQWLLVQQSGLETTNTGNIINQINILWNNQDTFGEKKSWILLIDTISNIKTLGYLIYTYYFYYFFMSGLILLIAMIGAIVLTMYKRKNAPKRQIIYKQVTQKFEHSIAHTM